ncbi:MAG: endolytic transglycosylase MltG [Rickettsiales bacterium]|jgi:UPF0755 protein|nr:endolytic transglycosylase MltG [Rickettsiales bacterium]
MRKKKKRKSGPGAFAFCIVFTCAFFSYFLLAPVAGNEKYVIEIERGERLDAVADKLHAMGAIRSRPMFKVWMYFTWSQNSIKAGEYEIAPRATLHQVKNSITSGRMLQRYVTIPEGLTLLQIYDALDMAPDLAGKVEIAVEEGDLLPQTYAYDRTLTKNDVVIKMKEAMERELAREWAERDEGLPIKSPKEAVILASIIEKETGVPEERPLVASVFVNRLNKGMRLQSDPTVVYTLTKKYGSMGGRKLYRKDLEIDTPYNTYTRRGLPAGAICNPGIESIRSVLHPPKTDYLYFVAKEGGGHRFAKTLEEHERNRAEWKNRNNQ